MSLFSKLFTARKTSPIRNAPRLRVESLEDRALPSTFGLANGVLSITGTGGHDKVSFQPLNGVIYIRAGISDAAGNGDFFITNSYAASDVSKVVFNGLGGNDTFLGSQLTIPVELHGGADNDTLEGGSGNDALYGDSGDDAYKFDVDSPLGTDSIYEADDASTDTLDFSASTAPVTADLLARNQKVSDNLTLNWVAGWGVENAIGGSGNDTITGTDYHNKLDGGAGNDLLIPRGGNDTLIGGAGDDAIYRGPGNLTIDGGTGANVTLGLDPRVPDAARLSQAGSLSASLSDAGNGQKALTLAGPSGIGFQLVGNWTSDGAAAETFTATGTVTLKSAMGDVPLPLVGGPMKVSTSSDPWAGCGAVTAVTVVKNGLFDVSTVGNSWFNNHFDASVILPGANWGVKLGRDVRTELKAMGIDAPVCDAIPYFYATASAGFGGSVSVGDISISGGGTMGAAFDPADPYVFVGTHVSASPVNLAFGGSLHGQIPFTPAMTPTDYHGTLYGHIYRSCDLDLFDLVKVPLTLKGAQVFDLDANGDGQLIGGLANSRLVSGVSAPGQVGVKDLFTSGHKFRTDQILSGLGDIAVGTNVGADLSFGYAGFGFKMPVGAGTVIYDGPTRATYGHFGTVSVAEAADLKGTPLEGLTPYTSSVDFTLAPDTRTRLTLAGQANAMVADVGWRIDVNSTGIHGDVTIDLGSYAGKVETLEVTIGKVPGVVIPSDVSESLRTALRNMGGVKAHLTGDIHPASPGSARTFSFNGKAEMTLLGKYSKDWQVSCDTGSPLWVHLDTGMFSDWYELAFEGAIQTYQAAYHYGKELAETAWTSASEWVTQTWDLAGNRLSETFYENSQKVRDTFVEGGNLVREFWITSLGSLGRFVLTHTRVVSDLDGPSIDALARVGNLAIQIWTDGVETFHAVYDTLRGYWNVSVDTYHLAVDTLEEGWNDFVDGVLGLV